MSYTNVQVPEQGQKITMQNGKLQVPDQPIIPFIEGDGIGVDIWPASRRILDAAVEKAYGGKRKNRLDGSFRRGKSLQKFQYLAAR